IDYALFMNILIVIGTDRKDSYSRKIIPYITSLVHTYSDFTSITIADPALLQLSYDKNDPEYTKMVKNADGFLVVTPEYNHSFPGTLKTLLDMEFELYKRKPVALVPV